MALMNCPECGRGVADTADLCPECGYDLYIYREGLKIDAEIERQLVEYERNVLQKPVLYNNVTDVFEYRDIDTQRSIIKFFMVLLCGGGALAAFVLRQEGESDGALVMLLFAIGLGMVGYFALKYIERDSQEKLRQLNVRQQTLIDNYEQNKADSLESKRKSLLYEKQRKLESIANARRGVVNLQSEQTKYIPKCPTCQSPDIVKIGNFEKAEELFWVGGLSQKIKRQWRCKNCGHEW